MRELGFEAAVDLARRIQRGELSSEELLDHYLARAERWNPQLNALVTRDDEAARSRAKAADAARGAGGQLEPFHGLPISVKDSIETADLRTTAGYPPLAEHVPARSAPAVERLEAAGALVFAKSNTPVLAGDWQTHNPLFGVTRNPWDVERTPGGSSGGSAAAVAAGLTALEVGSDIAGSIRLPAGWCGIYGHKPSHGIVPTRGHIPGPPGARSEADLAVLGPMARSAADLDVALRSMAGPLPERARAWRLELPPPRRASLREYRVGVWLEDPAYPVGDEVAEVLHAAVDAIARAGARVDSRARPAFGLDDVIPTYLRLFWPLFVSGLPPTVFDDLCRSAAELPADADGPYPRMVRFGTERHREWLAANEARERLRAQLAELFERCDVLVCPVTPVPAIAHDHREPMWERTLRVNGEERPYYDLFGWIGLATVTLFPATVAPAGRTRTGLPVGLQIVGPFLEDRTPIDFAARLSEVLGGFEPPSLGSAA